MYLFISMSEGLHWDDFMIKVKSENVRTALQLCYSFPLSLVNLCIRLT